MSGRGCSCDICFIRACRRGQDQDGMDPLLRHDRAQLDDASDEQRARLQAALEARGEVLEKVKRDLRMNPVSLGGFGW